MSARHLLWSSLSHTVPTRTPWSDEIPRTKGVPQCQGPSAPTKLQRRLWALEEAGIKVRGPSGPVIGLARFWAPLEQCLGQSRQALPFEGP